MSERRRLGGSRGVLAPSSVSSAWAGRKEVCGGWLRELQNAACESDP